MCWELCNGNCHSCDITWLWGSYCDGCKAKLSKQEGEKKTKASISRMGLDRWERIPTDWHFAIPSKHRTPDNPWHGR